ncbi:Protein of unknown function [Pseudobutyrivibrio sp. ACV-2]|uniref:DUF4230 domain-containing protein n=1 Tax=Pseudobutyrivibrio sp. ACV-2 TaxID=1520801 RepID=UPI000895A1BB|nr:DUF4230 domain-containing protein [Pseudobutyrivibrio sp. ACV-2]SDZ77081.1 Protein of unknown function [Pseudobutyrivibrio sp. ACV-2]
MNKKTLNRLGITLIILLGIASIYLIITSHLNSDDSNSSFQNLVPKSYDETNTSYTTDFSIIEDGLNDMGFLITQEYYFTQVEEYTKEKQIAFWTSKSSFTYSYDGVVEAGVDFSKIKVSVDDNNKVITITIPDSEVHTVTVDENSFKEYDSDNKFWNPIKPKDFNNAQKEFKENAKKNALSKGLLDKADTQAKTIIANFVSQLIDTNKYSLAFN